MIQSLRLFFFLSLLTGIIYPMLVFFVATVFMPYKAEGSLIRQDEKIIASELIGQEFKNKKYFTTRIDNGNNSSALNQLSKDLFIYITKKAKIYDDIKSEIPLELVTHSASNLEPYISPEAASFQIERIAKERKISKEKIVELINEYTEKPLFKFLGEARVNVVRLNIALDKMNSKSRN